jgi:hemoglobin
MKEPNDILTSADIKVLVDNFYGRVREDALIGPIFNERIKDQWPKHLEKLYAFWETVLLNKASYSGSPFPPHAQLPIDHSHFERWLKLFYATIDNLFVGQKAEEAKWRAARMAEMFQSKIKYYKDRGSQPLM